MAIVMFSLALSSVCFILFESAFSQSTRGSQPEGTLKPVLIRREAPYSNSTSTVSISSALTTSSITSATIPQCPTCGYANPFCPTVFHWPAVSVSTIIQATVTIRINQQDNTTTTITQKNNATLVNGAFTTLGTVEWETILKTSPVYITSGIPTLPWTSPISTKPGVPAMPYSTNLASPTGYYNVGWLYLTLPIGSNTTTQATDHFECSSGDSTTFGLVPTATQLGLSSAYSQEVDESMWSRMVPASVLTSCVKISTCNAPLTAVLSVSALTATTTQIVSSSSKNTLLASATPASSTKVPNSTNKASAAVTTPTQTKIVSSKSPTTPTLPSLSATAKGATTTPNQATGGSAIEVSGTVISTPPSAIATTIGGSTIAVLKTSSTASSIATAVVNFTPAGTNPLTIGTQIITPGGAAITVSGTTISILPSASAIVIDGSTISAATSPSTPSLVTDLPNVSGAYVIGTATLVPGGSAITVSGVTISLAPSASDVVINGVTSVLGKGSPVVYSPSSQTATGVQSGSYHGRARARVAVDGWLIVLVLGLGVFID